MSAPPRILYCNCTYTQNISGEVKNEVLRQLCRSDRDFDAVADLCDLSARKDPALRSIAASDRVYIAACYPRAVKWLFHAGGAPLPEAGIEILNMREEISEDGIGRLLQSGAKTNQTDDTHLPIVLTARSPEDLFGSISSLVENGFEVTRSTPPPRPGKAVLDVSELDPDQALDAARAFRERTDARDLEAWKPWFPVIDFDRCTNCMQCLTFCLFDVFALDEHKQITVQNESNCKVDCPACARVCPQVAILFPKYEKSPINGDRVRKEDESREAVKVDISALLGGNLYASLRTRNRDARKRFSTERDATRALEERKYCLNRIKKELDIPDEVLNALPRRRTSRRASNGKKLTGLGTRKNLSPLPRKKTGESKMLSAMASLAYRTMRTTDLRLLWKFAYNFGYKSMRSVQRYKARLKRGETFPPFLYISITNGCNLRCQGCWVDVDGPQSMICFDDLNRLITSAKGHGNSFFGILGGEPFLHPDLIRILRAHPDCYFQVFTNGHPLTDDVASELRRAGNVTPLISVEGTESVSDARRRGKKVLTRTLAGIEASVRHRLITGVATSVCQSNFDDLVRESWIDTLIEMGVHYTWFHVYRPVGPDPNPDLALDPKQVLKLRRFVMDMRNRKPMGIVDAYWDAEGRALCPAVTGVSHHISPFGDVEPCPVIQFARDTIHDNDGDLYRTMVESKLLEDFRKTAARATRGCILLERPDLLKEVVERNGTRDTTLRRTAMAELEAMCSRPSQHDPGNEIPEENWFYRFAKKHWFFGFGAYT